MQRARGADHVRLVVVAGRVRPAEIESADHAARRDKANVRRISTLVYRTLVRLGAEHARPDLDREFPREPDRLIGDMNAHVDNQSAACVRRRRRVLIAQHAANLAQFSDQLLVQQCFRVTQCLVVPSLQSDLQHPGTRADVLHEGERLVQLRRERLFEIHRNSSRHERRRIPRVVLGMRRDHDRVQPARPKCGHRRAGLERGHRRDTERSGGLRDRVGVLVADRHDVLPLLEQDLPVHPADASDAVQTVPKLFIHARSTNFAIAAESSGK